MESLPGAKQLIAVTMHEKAICIIENEEQICGLLARQRMSHRLHAALFPTPPVSLLPTNDRGVDRVVRGLTSCDGSELRRVSWITRRGVVHDRDFAWIPTEHQA